ncbi:MAG: CopG family transcriptional regulator [Actinomycetes bacterium]
MKTAISVPDATYERVEEKAHELGWSRSEFYSTAAERLLNQLDQESLAVAIDDALEIIGDSDDSGPAAVVAGRRTLAGDN